MISISSIFDFYAHCAAQSHISFDLFDTLIRRRFLKVNEVHDMVSAYALSLVGRRHDSSPFDLTLLRYRMSDALKSFDGTGTQEPLIDHVWDRILSQHVADAAARAQIVSKVVDFELSVELENLGLIEGGRELLVKLRTDGKIVTAISDMYFDMAGMRRILRKLEILELFDHIYVSADSQLTKQTGDLFYKVLDDLGLHPSQLLHVGDNRHSDIAMAAEIGIDCILVEQHHLLELELPTYGKRLRIEQDVADIVKVHLASVLFDATDRRTEHLYFLARDGCAISAFLEKWRHPLVDRFLPAPPHSDMYVNRILACWGGVDFSGDWLVQVIGLVFWLNHGQASAEEMCGRLGVGEIPSAFNTEMLRAEKDTFRVAEILTKGGYKGRIKTEILNKHAQIMRYLHDVGFFDHSRVAFSDVGYSGTVLRDLNSLFVNTAGNDSAFAPPVMHLHLIATNSNYEANRPRSYPFVHFSPQVVLPCEQLPQDLQASYAWLELFFKHPTLKPILRLIEQDGKLQPELRHDAPSDNPIPTERVLAFAQVQEQDIILLWMAAVNYHAPLVGPVIERFEHPDPETIAQMDDEVFELHSVQGARRSIVLRAPGAREEAIALAAREGDYWIPGSIAASHALNETQALPNDTSKRKGSGISRVIRLVRGKRSTSRVPSLKKAHGFEPKFYRRFYPDLRHLGTDEALWQHYYAYGRSENRFANYEALITQLVAECGQIPGDFNPDGYLRLNADLAGRIDTSERALDHFMRFGRHEGRRYSHTHHDLKREFDILVTKGHITLTAKEAQQRAKGARVLDLFLHRHGVVQGPWIDEIEVVEFRALHSKWAGAVQNKAECIVALLEQGFERCPDLSLTCAFDPTFYQSQITLVEKASAADLYHHYLREGSQRGVAPSEATALQRIWGFPNFPEGFDWQAFAKSVELPSHAATSRAEILRQFVDAPGLKRLKYISGQKAGPLIEFLAARAWYVYGRTDEARQLYEAALALPGNLGAIHHRLGDLALHEGRKADALRHFRQSIETASPDRWSHINAANLLIEMGNYISAPLILAQCEEQWQQRAPWRRVRDRALHLRSRSVLRSLSARDSGLEAADTLYRDIAATLPPPKAQAGRGSGVLLLTMRAASSAQRDRSLDSMVTVHDLLALEQGDYLAALLAHDIVIFHEVPFTSEVLHSIALARSLGKRTVAWIGDLVHWEGYPLGRCEWNDAGANPSPLSQDQFVDLLLPARYCDQTVTTLAGCLLFLSRMAPETNLTYLPPMSSTRDDATARTRLVLIMPLHDVQAGDVQHLAAALHSAAMADPRLHFLVDARLAETRALRDIIGRWDRLGDDTSLPVLAKLIGTCDAVVQVLRTPSHQYAAWAEAKARGVATLVLQASAQVRDNGTTSRKEYRDVWIDELERLPVSAISDVSARIVAVAQVDQNVMKPAVRPPHDRNPAAASTPKPRIMLANIFFAPQVIGGATRVLKDNLDYCLDHHGDEFDFAVFCADEQNDNAGEWRVDAYRGIPVFRMATPQEINMDWRAANEMVGARFAAVLRAFKPDLVHIHCLQRLGVVLAETCHHLDIPYVVTLHDAWWLSDYPFLTDQDGRPVAVERDFRNQDRLPNVAPEISLLRAERLRKALLQAHDRFAVSQSFADLYAQCGIPARVIENGCSRITPLPKQAPRDGRIHLCHVGGLEHHKGAYLIEAALRTNSYKNLHVTVIDLARTHGEETQTIWGTTPVTIAGKMSTTELAAFYARMHVLLAPSTWPESYGLVSREAIAHGLWVVAGNLGAIGDPIEEGRNGFVVPVSDASGIAQALKAIDADPATYRNPPPSRALRLVDEQSAELVEFYRSIMSGEPSAQTSMTSIF